MALSADDDRIQPIEATLRVPKIFVDADLQHVDAVPLRVGMESNAQVRQGDGQRLIDGAASAVGVADGIFECHQLASDRKRGVVDEPRACCIEGCGPPKFVSEPEALQLGAMT